MSPLALVALVLFARGRASAPAPKPPAPSPSSVPLGSPALVRFRGKNIPVRFEMVSRRGKREAVWSVQNLGGSNLGTVQAMLKNDVGKSFSVDVASGDTRAGKGLILRAKWDGFVFVPQ